METKLTSAEKRALCAAARESIAASLGGRAADIPEAPPGCRQVAGAFVTLRARGALRGCIGRLRGAGPLMDTVTEMARAAAFEDPRFDPVQGGELGDIDIEITILGPFRKIDGAGEILIGRDGVYIAAAGRSGILLPQVATEYGWDAPTFLEHVCLKAGLPPGSWKAPGAQLYAFEGLVFGEKEA
ncbi:AmmeMemoRadiSam system protein A [bacterium]|nr:AmmeMemoRadiSam system protein A [bacterium]